MNIISMITSRYTFIAQRLTFAQIKKVFQKSSKMVLLHFGHLFGEHKLANRLLNYDRLNIFLFFIKFLFAFANLRLFY